MTPLCNDQLTCVLVPSYANPETWHVPTIYRVGDKGDKNGMPYTVKAFGTTYKPRYRFSPEKQDDWHSVWLIIKYKGDQTWKWNCLFIGDTRCFKEPLIIGGRHPNPVFDYYLPKDWPQPFLEKSLKVI